MKSNLQIKFACKICRSTLSAIENLNEKKELAINSQYLSNTSSLKTEEWMTTKEAAEFLRIKCASLLNLSSNGKIPYYKFQRRNRYLKSDLSQLLLSNRRGGFDGN